MLYLDIDDCATSPCQNGGSCTDQVNGYTCSCVDGYDGTNCETGNDATVSQIFFIEIKRYIGVSWLKSNIKEITYLTTFILKLLDIDECASAPCQNSGSCTDIVNGYTCNCVDGYDGSNCENGNNTTSFCNLLSISKLIFRHLNLKVF